MDPDSGESAAQWLARADEREIADVLWTYGEERMSRRIAAAIVARRAEQPLDAHRAAGRPDRLGDAARRSARSIRPRAASRRIRIFINRELADLEAGLDAALERLKPGGRLAVISFHSLEDRIVKHFIAAPRQGAAGATAACRWPHAFMPTLRADRRRAEGRRRRDSPPIRARAAPCCAWPRSSAEARMSLRLLLAVLIVAERRSRRSRVVLRAPRAPPAVRRADAAGAARATSSTSNSAACSWSRRPGPRATASTRSRATASAWCSRKAAETVVVRP